MIAPALPITEAEVADLVELHIDRAEAATSEVERSYNRARANYWSDFYLDHFCPAVSRPRWSPTTTPATTTRHQTACP